MIRARESQTARYAALMLGYVRGDALDMTQVVRTFGIKLSSLDEYARRVLETSAASA